MWFYILMIFLGLCLLVFIGMGIIFYLGMKVNQREMDEKMKNKDLTRPS